MTSRWQAAALCAAVAVAYSPSLGGGFLEFDDGWLIRDNPWMHAPAATALPAFFARFDLKTRGQLGAEYLPVRDFVMWSEVQLMGLRPALLRSANLVWYLLGLLLLRVYLRRTFPDARAAEMAVWLFALHPLHVEPVAWITGHKDMLAFVCVAAALYAHAGESRYRPITVPLLLLVAHFAKSPSVVAVGLLAAHDVYRGRRLRLAIYLPATVVALVATVVHVYVGRMVAMPAPIGEGGRLGLAATMGPVWLREIGHLLWPRGLSILYHVPDNTFSNPFAWLGWLLVFGLGAGVLFAWRRGHTLPVLAFAWFVLPHIPTSQLIVPLQNRMADRYLFLCVLGPAIIAGGAAARWRPARRIVFALAVALFALTVERSAVFADNLALWTDSSERLIAEIQGTPGQSPEAARAALGNLATELAKQDQLKQAELVYRAVISRWPQDPKAWNNLAEILHRQDRREESLQLFLEVLRRFPKYELGRKNYQLHFGEIPREQ